MELQTGEIFVEISVDDLRLRIWEIIRPWNWGVKRGGGGVVKDTWILPPQVATKYPKV